MQVGSESESGNLEIHMREIRVNTYVERFNDGWWCCIAVYQKRGHPNAEPFNFEKAAGPFSDERKCRTHFKGEFRQNFLMAVAKYSAKKKGER